MTTSTNVSGLGVPRVSVITTAFNAECFIEAAVRSVLAQRDVEVEHIVVDDGSADRTVEVLRSIDDPRVRVIDAGRVGRGRALNLGIDACRTDYVAIQDADDLSHPDRLATELGVLRVRAELAAVGSGQMLFRGAEPPPWTTVIPSLTVRTVMEDLVYYNPLSHSSMLFRRESLTAVGGYDTSRTTLFDWDLYVRLAASGAAIGKVKVPLVAKRVHDDQFFEGRNTARYALACLRLQWRAISLLRRNRLAGVTLPALLAYRLMPRPFRIYLRETVTGPRHFRSRTRPSGGHDRPIV